MTNSPTGKTEIERRLTNLRNIIIAGSRDPGIYDILKNYAALSVAAHVAEAGTPLPELGARPYRDANYPCDPTAPSEGPTPRTDAWEKAWSDGRGGYKPDGWARARQLERELAERTADFLSAGELRQYWMERAGEAEAVSATRTLPDRDDLDALAGELALAIKLTTDHGAYAPKIWVKCDDAEKCIAALRAMPRSTSGSSVGWLIENGKVGSELRYRTMVEGLSAWTADHQEALRFCRREDAERFAADDDGAWLIYQHMWHDRPSVPSASGARTK